MPFLLNDILLTNYYENSKLIFSANRLGNLIKEGNSVDWYYTGRQKKN